MSHQILITSNTSWFVYNFFSHSIRDFIKSHYQVHVLAPYDKYTEKLLELGCVYHDLSIDRSGANLVSEMKSLFCIYKTISKLSPDCVINFTPKLNIYSVLVCKTLNISVVNSIAGLGSIISERGFKPWLGRLLLRFTQPLADHIIFQNNDDLSVYLSNKFAVRDKTSRVNGIGVKLDKFVPHEADDDGIVRFILFARMLKNKGVVEFVEAAEAVSKYYIKQRKVSKFSPKVEFALLGFIDESNPQGISKSLLNFWNDQSYVEYLGETDDVFSIVKEYDCVVLPSYYREGIPQCLIESCAMAKPIITTNNVGCKETVIDGKSGYIIPPKNVSELTEAMLKMVSLSHSARIEMGKVGRKKAVRDFCHTQVSQHYMKIIKQVVNVK